MSEETKGCEAVPSWYKGSNLWNISKLLEEILDWAGETASKNKKASKVAWVQNSKLISSSGYRGSDWIWETESEIIISLIKVIMAKVNIVTYHRFDSRIVRLDSPNGLDQVLKTIEYLFAFYS